MKGRGKRAPRIHSTAWRQLPLSLLRTLRTAVTLALRAACYCSEPRFTAMGTEPPHLLLRVAKYFTRLKGAVLRGMPLLRDVGIQGCQIVVAGKEPFVRAVGAVEAIAALGNSGFPFMPLLATPPILFSGTS